MVVSGSLQDYFDKLLRRVQGLKAVIVSDKDGVVIVRAALPDVPPNLLEVPACTTFAVASDQASKLGLKRNTAILSRYQTFQLVQFNHTPLAVSLFAEVDANAGMLLDLDQDLKKVTEIIAAATHEHT